MTNPKYHFNLTGGSGSAERVDMLDNERARVDHGTYTACACESDPAWYIKGTSFDFDTGADEGIAHNGVLFFQGVPVFASPWLSFPLTGDRRSGLLPPTFSLSSTTGFEAIDPVLLQHRAESRSDRDAAPDDAARRADGRRRTAICRPRIPGTITGEFLPDDRQTHTNRYAIYIQHQPELRRRVRRLHQLQQGLGQSHIRKTWRNASISS